MSTIDSSIHAGNYYTNGVQRILGKMKDMGIAVPVSALEKPSSDPGFQRAPLSEFSRIELAMLDWFEGRDYDQAQALIHFKPPCAEWHAIFSLDPERPLAGLSDGTLCPSLLDALGAIIDSCDDKADVLNRCVRNGRDVIAVIGGRETLRITPVSPEPFDVAIRDRVRTAFKGIRRHDYEGMAARAARLPGFKSAGLPKRSVTNANSGEMLLGFPGNWAFAMRNALKQLGIEVKQSQAQELAAVFFGASNWHQLVKYQDQINGGNTAVELAVTTPEGNKDYRYYFTGEEALFATAKALEAYPEPVVVQHFDLSVMRDHLFLGASPARLAQDADHDEIFFEELCIDSGGSDYWNLEDYGTPALREAAQMLLNELVAEGVPSTTNVIYGGRGDAKAVLEGLLERKGIPASHVVYINDYALAVRYVPEPNGSSELASKLSIFRLNGVRYEPQETVTMYKADVRVSVQEMKMTIRPDYGRDAPIVIPLQDLNQAQQLFALTHADGIFTRRVPEQI